MNSGSIQLVDPVTTKLKCSLLGVSPLALLITSTLSVRKALNKTINDGARVPLRIGSDMTKVVLSASESGILLSETSTGAWTNTKNRPQYSGLFTYRVMRFYENTNAITEIKPLEFELQPDEQVESHSAVVDAPIFAKSKKVSQPRIDVALWEIQRWKAGASFVYFATNGTHCKIGVSNDPIKRLCSLQTGSSLPLQLLSIVRGSRTLEQQLHKVFSAERVQGEWFALSPTVKAFLSHLSRMGAALVDQAA